MSVAQTPAGGIALHTDRLRVGVDSFSVYSIGHGDTTRIGWARDELRSDGVRLTRIYSQADTIFGAFVDTIVSDARDLRPLWHSMHSSWVHAYLQYSKVCVTGWVRLPKRDSSTIQVRLTAPVDDPAMFDVIARASELRDNLLIEGTGFDLETRKVRPFKGRVTHSETQHGQESWVFRGYNGDLMVTFWIDKRTRALRRSLMRLRPDFTMMLVAERS